MTVDVRGQPYEIFEAAQHATRFLATKCIFAMVTVAALSSYLWMFSAISM